MDSKRAEFEALWSRKTSLLDSHQQVLSFSENLQILKRIPLTKDPSGAHTNENDMDETRQSCLWDCMPVDKLEA